jgi:hypothetical protein
MYPLQNAEFEPKALGVMLGIEHAADFAENCLGKFFASLIEKQINM